MNNKNINNRSSANDLFLETGFLNLKQNAAIKIRVFLCVFLILMLIVFTGCQSDPGSAQGSDFGEQVSSDVSWETQDYSDDYLSYEIPSNWMKSDAHSNSERRFAFFQPEGSPNEFSSNVNIQITKLNTGKQQKKIDYSLKLVQEEFHSFLLEEMGMPKEASEGEFKVTQSESGMYIYSLSFERTASNDTLVRQTVFFPMNLEHSIVIWSTDFSDNASPAADDVARHICETLEVVGE